MKKWLLVAVVVCIVGCSGKKPAATEATKVQRAVEATIAAPRAIETKAGPRVETLGKVSSEPALPVKQNQKREVVASVSAIDLWEYYKDNAADAKLKYTGKYVEIYGEIQDVKRQPNGDFYVGLRIAADLTTPANVNCRIASGQLKPFAGSKIGDKIHLTGIPVEMTSNAAAWQGRILELRDCQRIIKE